MHKEICLNEKRILLPLRLEGLEVVKELKPKRKLLDKMGRRADDPERIIERFLSKFDISGIDECWEWKDWVDKGGYGYIRTFGKRIRAHRQMKQFELGKILKPEEQVCHHCDNPKCVNPKHLFVGTTQENTQDRVNKNRTICGEGLHFSKLKEAQVREIKKLFGKMSYSEIASLFGVCKATVSHIQNKRIWKHL